MKHDEEQKAAAAPYFYFKLQRLLACLPPILTLVGRHLVINGISSYRAVTVTMLPTVTNHQHTADNDIQHITARCIHL